jgi:hypothetical protein
MKLHELKQIIREEIEKELSSNLKGTKVEDLKLYGKYKNPNKSSREYIFIGIDKDGDYQFLTEGGNLYVLFSHLKYYGFNPDKIVKDLNLETFINEDGEKCIKGYYYAYYSKGHVENYLKPI